MSSPRKRHSPMKTATSPVKKYCSPMKLTPQNHTGPSHKKYSDTTPVLKLNMLQLDGKSCKKQKEGKINLPDIRDYDPVGFIRCHFGDREAKKRKYSDNDPRDEFTKVWKCAFEPHPREHGRDTGIVATCGGETVCLIDCSTGKVMKRFKQQQEQFYTLAWTTLTVQSQLDGRVTERRTNILAVAGYNARIFLLHPEQFICYKHWGDGVPNKTVARGAYYVTDMVFHPQEPVWLFSGASDETVTLWDIGTPSGPTHHTDIRKLMTFVCESSILNLVLDTKTGHLVAGTDEGIVAWTLPKKKELISKSSIRRKICAELDLPASNQEVDGLTLVSEDVVACKCVEDSCIYVWNLTEALSRAKNNTTVRPLFTLEWKYTTEKYIQPSSADGKLVCGDDEGNIWLYNLKPLLRKKPQQLSLDLYRPSRILLWPECEINMKDTQDRQMVDILDKPVPLIMNHVCLSASGEFLVGVTDNNLVCVWKMTD